MLPLWSRTRGTVCRRIAALVAFASLLVLCAPAAQATDDAPDTRRDPLTLAKERLDEARTQATDLSGRISEAQTQQAKLAAEIADAEQRIPALRAKAVELRAMVKARAAQLYIRHGGSAAFASTMDVENTQDGVRAAHLTGTIGDQELDAATKLRETAELLAAQEVELKQQRADLQKKIADLAPLNDLLQKKLQVASQLYDKVHALVGADGPKQGVDLATDASVCPVKGLVVFTDDFFELRPGGPHPGIDMAALPETPVVAVADGVWRHDVGDAGGNGAWLTGFGKFSYYYAHFSRYEGDGGLVKAGDVIGYVGSTGNATGPHLHFEIHPGREGENLPVDPFATLLTLCNDNLPPARAN